MARRRLTDRDSDHAAGPHRQLRIGGLVNASSGWAVVAGTARVNCQSWTSVRLRLLLVLVRPASPTTMPSKAATAAQPMLAAALERRHKRRACRPGASIGAKSPRSAGQTRGPPIRAPDRPFGS